MQLLFDLLLIFSKARSLRRPLRSPPNDAREREANNRGHTPKCASRLASRQAVAHGFGWLTMRSVFGHDRAMLESAARARPTSLEAVHFPLQAAQAVSDCSQF